MPELAVLFEDANMTRQVHVYRIADDHGEIKPVSLWTSSPVEGSATKLVPLPGSAVLVLGDESLTVLSASQKQPLSVSKKQAAVTAWEWIDSEQRERLLLSDDEGELSLVVLRYGTTKGGSQERNVREIVVERLGDIPVATSLSYLSDGCLYVGSHFGDQILVRLHTQPVINNDSSNSGDQAAEQLSQGILDPLDPLAPASHGDSFDPLEQPLGAGSVEVAESTPNTFLEPLEVFQNLAPVVDLDVVGINERSSNVNASSSTHNTDDSTRKQKSQAETTSAVDGGSNYGSVVTCSGEQNRPSLRAVRNGVGIQQLAGINIAGLVGAWSLTVELTAAVKGSGDLQMDVDREEDIRRRQVLIVLGLVQHTRVVGWTEPTEDAAVELEELSLPGWRLDEQTIACGMASDGSHAVQITSSGAVLLDSSTWQRKSVWKPSDIGMRAITAASVHGDQIALAVDGTAVVYLQAQKSLVCVAQRRLDHAVSCIDIHPWTAQASITSQKLGEAMFVALGLWGVNDICLLRLPSLEPVSMALSLAMSDEALATASVAISTNPAESEQTVEAATAATGQRSKPKLQSNESLPRSILMSTLGNTPYLLVGLGDGRLHQFALRQSEQQELSVCEHKCVVFGTRPLILTPFMNHGAMSVFAASDHPSVLFANRRTMADASSSSSSVISRLLYANVDSSDIMQVAPIDSTSFPESLCLVSSTGALSIGRADPAQRLHVHSFPLPRGAAPHRLAHHQEAALYGVATIHAVDANSLAVSTADMALWEREALMETNAQQGAQVSDARGQVVVKPPVEVGRFSLLDSQTTKCLSSILFRPYEMPESLCVASFECLARPDTTAATGTATSSSSLLLDDSDAEMHDAAGAGGFAEQSSRSLDSVFVLGTSIVKPEADDASSGRILVAQWDALLRRMRMVGCFTTHGAVYSLVPFRGMLLAAANNRLLLLGWQRRDPNVAPSSSMREIRRVGFNSVYLEDSDYELVVLCSQQTQIASLSVAVNGDCIAVGDVMSSVSVYRYEEVRVPVQPRGAGADQSSISLEQQQQQQQQASEGILRRRLVPVARDYTNAWTTRVAAIPPPLASNSSTVFPDYISEEAGVVGTTQQQQQQQIPDYASAFRDAQQKRFLVSDAHGNLFRLAMPRAPEGNDRTADSSIIDPQRLCIEARWHLSDSVNTIRAGSLVMDVSDPEFPNLFRPTLIYGTVRGAVGVVANVENGKLGRVLDRLQTNMAHLLPTPGLWDYERWRGYSSDQRNSRAFGFLDGDLIEQFLDLSPETQQLVFSGGYPLLVDKQTVELAEHARKAQFWMDYSRIEMEGEVAVLSQMAVSDIGQRENLSLDYVIRLVESLTRLH
ncbi:DNA damage-binding protein 1a [Coemansia sp. RSA 1804]|nr:DNA damage-binding protein 1a [Coemansia sp. RSA 1804]